MIRHEGPSVPIDVNRAAFSRSTGQAWSMRMKAPGRLPKQGRHPPAGGGIRAPSH